MKRSLVSRNRVFAPYFIFVRCNGVLTDADILERVGLAKYSAARFAPQSGLYAVLANDGSWTMLADNWNYWLYFWLVTGVTIENFAAEYDVFTCSVGDACDSFAFTYYRNGRLVRKYEVTDPSFSGGSVTQDVGESLKFESTLLTSGRDHLEMVLSLAESIGIKTDYTEEELRVYVSPEVVLRSPEIAA